MAGNSVNVNLEVSDSSGSLKKRNEEAKELNRNLSAAAASAEKALRPASRYRQQPGEGTEYGRARGSMGTTGASARDFANQAQGLGGLVRIYATIAANLFAVGAAFNALKDAANTTSMVQGMNQLGAASGIALGSMAEKFVQATGGAISLREAMSSVTKASSAGLSNKQTLEIAKGAKQAAQALGLDMTDAVNRLTRGITKLEPELVDELGLYTKLQGAVDKYALSIGKSSAALSDYERRQAYAVALLAELKDKYGGIDLASNPYEQLAASIRNLAQSVLEIVNKVFIPIAKVLAENSTLLGAVLAGLAFKLLKMAVPALTSWRDELVKTAAAAKKNAADITESFAFRNVQSTMAKYNIPELQNNLDDAKARYAKASKDIADIQARDNLRQTKTSKNIAAGVYGEDPKDFTRTQSQIRALNAQNTQAATEYANALQRAKDAKRDELRLTKEINTAQNQAETQFQKPSMGEAARQRISRQAGARSESLTALAQVASDTTKGGFTAGIQNLEKNVSAAANLSAWDKLKTKATGWAIAGVTEAKIFLSSLSGLFNVLGLLAAAVGVLDLIFGKNGEAVSDFDSMVKQNQKTVENATEVMKKYGDSISAAGSIAKGNSISQLTEDLGQLSDKLQRADTLATWFDRMVDDVKQLAGKGLKQNFATSVAENLAAQLKLIPEGPLKAAAEEKLKEVLEVGNLSEGAMREALAATSNDKVIEKARKGNAALEALSRRQKIVGETVKQVGEAVKTADEKFAELGQSLALTDPISKFGQAMIQVGIDVTKAFRDTESTVGAVEKLLEKPRILGLLGPDAFKELTDIKSVLPDIQKNVDSFTLQIQETQALLNSYANIDMTGMAEETVKAINAKKLSLQEKLGTLTVNLEANKLNFAALSDQLNKIVTKVIGEGYSLIERMASAAQAQAALTISKNLLQGLSGPGIAKAMGDLNIKEIDLQRQQNSIMTTLNNTMIRANALKERELAEKGVKDITEKAKSEGRDLTLDEETQKKRFEKTIAGVDIVTGAMGKRQGISRAAIEGMSPEAASIAAEYAASTAGARATDAGLVAKRRIELDNQELGILKETRDESYKVAQAQNSLVGIKKQIADLSFTAYEYLSDTQIAAKQLLETEKQSSDQELARVNLQNERAGLVDRLRIAERNKDADAQAALNGLIQSKDTQIGQLEKQQTEESKLLTLQQAQARITNEYAKQNKIAADRFMLQQQQRDMALDLINSESELLGIRSQVQVMLPDEIAQQEKRLKLDQLSIQYDSDIAKARKERSDKMSALQEKEDLAKKANQDYDKKYFADQRAVIDSFYDNQLEHINRINDAKREGVTLQYSMTDRMKAYDQVFRNSFSGMADAIVDFAKTGKLSFKSMIDSMIEGLIRYELQQQALLAYKAVGGATGIMNFLANLVFGGSSPASTGSSAPVPGGPGGIYPTYGGKAAKGAVYDGGILQFAKGGMFTNSVVTEPTLFKFARGTGLMGEAGPEAIMPLRRDSDGNLGVMAKPQGNNVEVVVNNYSGEKAEARETVDSRGNRKIEVVVGEMVASEVGRKNSPMQQAITGNFMTRPSITRR